MSIPRGARRAAARYGPLVDDIAAGYTNPYTGHRLTGEQLLLKLSKGENAFRLGGRPSSAGARGPTQFTPGSRRVAIDRFGIDPWRSYDEAFHAAALHLRGKINGSKGLEGYNPGSASYPHYILSQKIGPVRETRGAGPVTTPGAAGGASAGPDVQPGQDLTAALIGALTQPQPRQASAPPMPAFAAKAPTPAGYQPQQPTAPPVKDDPNALLSLLAQAGPSLSGGEQQPAAPGSSGGGGATLAGGRGGRVIIAAGAERPGVPMAKSTLGFLHRVAGLARRPITVGTGTRHSKFTVDGNVSDHWDGHAADIPVPVDSRRGDMIAAHALQAAGVPWRRAVRMAQRGGLYTLNVDGHRVQVIWKTYQGGNHHNHVHVGFR